MRSYASPAILWRLSCPIGRWCLSLGSVSILIGFSLESHCCILAYLCLSLGLPCALLSSSGLSCALLGSPGKSRAILVPSLGLTWRLLGAIWRHLCSTWCRLGPIWRRIGSIQRHLHRTWRYLCAIWCKCGCAWRDVGPTLALLHSHSTWLYLISKNSEVLLLQTFDFQKLNLFKISF